MISSSLYAGFINDKQRFFSDKVNTIAKTNLFLAKDEHDFSFIHQYRFIIESEFNHLFTILKNNSDNREEFWLYCYYCCKLLEAYYADIAYDKPELAEEYAEVSKKIEDEYINKKAVQNETERQSFLNFLQKRIASDLGALVTTPLHTSKIRTSLGMTNLYRLLFLFSRITIRQWLIFANELKLLNKLEQIFGRHIDLDRILAQINSPTGLFNILSVGLFLARFILNVGLLVKHTLVPNEQEEEISWTKRLFHELFKRHYHFGNDAVWASVNLLSNYASFFNISASVANWLTAGFLIFDVLMLVIDRTLAEQDFKLKQAQYNRELNSLQESSLSDEQKVKQYAILKEQLKLLELEWKATRAFYNFNISAAVLLLASFTAPLIFTATLAATISYTICTIAIAMYLSAGDYQKYVKASDVVKRYKDNFISDELIEDELAEARTARNEFVLSLVKTSVMPMVMVAIFAVSWEAALLVSLGYLGYRYVSSAWDDHKKTQPELPKDEEGDFTAPSI